MPFNMRKKLARAFKLLTLALLVLAVLAVLAGRHREDLAILWSRGEYHPVLTTREAVRPHAESVLTLTPTAPR